jgi:hypothetical protein
MRCAAQVICAVVLVLTLVGPATAAKKRTTPKKKPLPAQKSPTFNSDVQNEMSKYLGIRYRSGGSSTSGVDCSGFVGLVYRNLYGVTNLPHQSRSLYASPAMQRVPMESLSTGDLVYFTSSKKSKRINHVGIYLSDGKFIHAARGKGVVISSLDDPHWSARVAGANRFPRLETRYRGAGPVLDPETTPASSSRDASFSFFSHEVLPSSDDSKDPSQPHVLGQSMGIELGFAQALPGYGMVPFRLTLFQESLSMWRGTEVTAPLSPERDSLWTGERTAFFPIQGIRVGSEIRPFEWLSLSPSLTYFKYDTATDDSGLPKHSVGVDLSMGSSEDGWMLSTGFRYSSLINPKRDSSLVLTGSYAEEYDPQHALDMSFTLMQRISNKLSISIMGERLQRPWIAPSDLSRDEKNLEEHRFSLMFNFSY